MTGVVEVCPICDIAGCHHIRARATEKAADPALTAAQAEIARITAERDAAMAGRVKVKPLVWRESYGVFRAETAFGDYVVTGRIMRFLSRAERVCDDLATAQAEAQADYEARIIAAIQPDTERAEPVAWRMDYADGNRRYTDSPADVAMSKVALNGAAATPLYTAPQAREITVQEAAEVPEVKALIEAAKSAADALDMAYGDPHDEETQHRYSSSIRSAIADMQKGG